MDAIQLPLHNKIPLFGRDEEIALIRKAFGGGESSPDEKGPSSSSFSSSRGLLITGAAGVGKSSLVQTTLHDPDGSNTYFCDGKHDQYDSNPLQGFAAAFENLCNRLNRDHELKQGDGTRDDADQKRLDKALRKELSNSELKSLSQAVPATKSVLQSSRDDEDEKNIERRCKSSLRKILWSLECLKSAFKKFLKVVLDFERREKIVLYLDDIQWADLSTIELFAYLARCMKEHPRFLLVCSCRTSHMHVIEKLQSTNDVQELKLLDISVEATTDLLVFLTKRSRGMESLAEVVHSRTSGNPFHTLQFLQMLQETKYLFYSISTNQWDFDLEAIEDDTSITDNVVDIVRHNLRRLPVVTLVILGVSSFVGTYVDLQVVATATMMEIEKIKINLQVAKDARLINWQKDSNRFRFVHDRIQEEANKLLPNEVSREDIHSRIGTYLLDKTNCPTSENWMLPVAVSNLNRASKLVASSRDSTLDLVDLNINAAKSMIDKASFVAASDFLRFGIDLLEGLDGDKWIYHYSWSLQLSALLAQMHLCLGDFDDCHARIDEIEKNAKSVDDKLEAFCVKIEALHAEKHDTVKLEPGFQMLDELGVRCCRKPSLIRIAAQMIRNHRLMSSKSDEDILNLPPISDAHKDVAHKILRVLGKMAWFAGENNALALIAIKTLEVLLKYGHGKFSAAAIAGHAFGCSLTGDIDGVRRFGRLSLKLLETYPDDRWWCDSMNLIIGIYWHLDSSLHQCLDKYIQVYDLGMKIGETHSASLAALAYCNVYSQVGLPLGAFLADIKRFSKQIEAYRHTIVLQSLVVVEQYALNMAGNSDNPAVLDGEAMSLEHFFETIGRDNEWALLTAYDSSVRLAFHFGDFIEAGRYADLVCKMHDADGTNFNGQSARLFQGLTYAQLARLTGKRRYVRKVILSLKHFEVWVKKELMNVQQKYFLLQAELLTLKKTSDTNEVLKMYNQAVTLASKTGFANDALLSNELCGNFLLSRGDHELAKSYLFEALRWAQYVEASAISQKLEKMHRHMGLTLDCSEGASGNLRGRRRFKFQWTAQHKDQFPYPEFLRSSYSRDDADRLINESTQREEETTTVGIFPEEKEQSSRLGHG